MYTEEAIKEIKDELQVGVRVGGQKIIALRFADDIAFCTEKEEDLQILLEKTEDIFGNYGMKLNKNKTKVMSCSKLNKKQLNINIKGEHIEQVQSYCYLGSKINDDGKNKLDIINRIAQGKKAFQNKNHLLTTNSVRLDTRKNFLKIYVWSVTLYGSETRTVSATEKKKLEAFEMWCYRKMLKIIWSDRITNEEVLERIKEKR